MQNIWAGTNQEEKWKQVVISHSAGVHFSSHGACPWDQNISNGPYPQPCYLAFGMLVPPTSNLSCTPCSESSASESLNGQGIPSLSIEVLLTYPLSRESFSGLSVVHLWPLGIPCYCVPGWILHITFSHLAFSESKEHSCRDSVNHQRLLKEIPSLSFSALKWNPAYWLITKSWYLLSPCCVPDSVLRHALSYFIFTTTPWDRNLGRSHFTDEDVKTQRGQVTYLLPSSWMAFKSRPNCLPPSIDLTTEWWTQQNQHFPLV